jgi:putative ABC transport system ATP-binding protein
MADERPLIELSEVVKVYDTGEVPFEALRGVDLTVHPGEFIGLIGKSGSGKTTLVNMITGIDRPTSGEVVVDGTPVHGLSENKLARWRGKTIGVVFQFFQLLPTLTIAENVMLPMDFCRTFPGPERRPRAIHLLEQVELADQADKLPSSLSGGQQQRAAIARALAMNPQVMLYDEPTSALDPELVAEVLAVMKQLDAEGMTQILVTHEMRFARDASDYIVFMEGGHIVEISDEDEIFESPKDERTRQFLGRFQ